MQTATSVTLTTSVNPAFVSEPITFTATVKPAGIDIPSGTITFFDGVTQLGTSQPLVGGVASLPISSLVAGTHSISAVYSGDTNFLTSISAALSQSVLDFNFALTANAPGGISTQTVQPGDTATYAFTVSPIGGPFTFPVVLSATGLPSGAVVTFTPNPINIGAAPADFKMSVKVPALAELHRTSPFGGGSVIAFGMLLLPFSRRFRKRARRMTFAVCAVFLMSLAALGGIAGCGVPSGFFGQAPQTYTMTVIGTATGTGQVVLQHQTTVTLVVE